MKTLTTERLIIRPFRKGDEDDIFAILLDKEGAYFCDGEEPFQPEDRYTEQYAELMEDYAAKENRLMLELKGEHKVIGLLSFWESDLRHVPTQDLVYQLHPDYQHKGYATEAAKELIRYLFEETDTQLITAQAITQNLPSIALLRRLGFTHEGTIHKADFYPPVGIVNQEWFYLDKPDSPAN